MIDEIQTLSLELILVVKLSYDHISFVILTEVVIRATDNKLRIKRKGSISYNTR